MTKLKMKNLSASGPNVLFKGENTYSKIKLKTGRVSTITMLEVVITCFGSGTGTMIKDVDY